MAEWPEPEADPEERQRWWGRLALAGAVCAAAILLSGDELGQWRLPDSDFPTFDMPEISTPDLRGREVTNPAPAPGTATDPIGMMLADPPTDGSPLVQTVSFEDCRRTIDGASQSFGPPAVLQDTSARYVARFKLAEAAITITCADGGMTIEQGR